MNAINELKKKIISFDDDILNAMAWSNNNTVTGDNIVVLPIPITPRNSSIELPNEVKISDMPRYFDRHPDQAIIIAASDFFKEYSLVGGHLVKSTFGVLFNPLQVVSVFPGRYRNSIITSTTVMYCLKPSDIMSISNNKFNKNDYELKIG